MFSTADESRESLVFACERVLERNVNVVLPLYHEKWFKLIEGLPVVGAV